MAYGPAGFRGAPITKALIFATSISTIALQVSWKISKRRNNKLLRGVIHALVFKYPGELLFGDLLLYQFRVLERHMGSGKYGAFVILVSLLGFLLQNVLHHAVGKDCTSGPYPLIFGSLVGFFLDVPALNTFKFIGITLSDKFFIYFAAGKLLLTVAHKSILAGLCGVVAGIVYFSNVLRIRNARLPRALEYLVATAAQ